MSCFSVPSLTSISAASTTPNSAASAAEAANNTICRQTSARDPYNIYKYTGSVYKHIPCWYIRCVLIHHGSAHASGCWMARWYLPTLGNWMNGGGRYTCIGVGRRERGGRGVEEGGIGREESTDRWPLDQEQRQVYRITLSGWHMIYRQAILYYSHVYKYNYTYIFI